MKHTGDPDLLILCSLLGIGLSMAGLGRMTLILLGRWKSPILRMFERYAPDEAYFYPLPPMLFWCGLLVIACGLLVEATDALDMPLYIGGVPLLYAAYALYGRKRAHWRAPHAFFGLPRWYAELIERTTRDERRHLAYMWLNLPRRTRQRLEADDEAFRRWADLIILSTIYWNESGDVYAPDHVNPHFTPMNVHGY